METGAPSGNTAQTLNLEPGARFTPNGIDREIVRRMLQRGRMRMVQAVLYEDGYGNAQKMFDHWRSFADCAAVLLNGVAAVMALHDEASVMQSDVEAAFSRLPDDCERLSFTEMKRLVRPQGVDLATDTVANGNVDAVVQLQDAVSPVIKTDDKHAVSSIDMGDGGIVHGGAPSETTIVAQGGAA